MDHCLFLSTERLDVASALIRWKTEADWSHVGFMRLADGATFSAMCDSQGVAWRPANPKAKILKLSHAAPEAIDKALAHALTQAGRPYDRLDIVGIALGRNWFTADRFICSTLVCWAFEQIYMDLLNATFIPREHITPRDILLSPYVTELKENL